MKVNIVNQLSKGVQTYRAAERVSKAATVFSKSAAAGGTVSFSGNYFPKAGNKFVDIFKAQVEAQKNRMNRIATIYLDVLESVATQLKTHGFSFDRKYCELSPVKSADSYTSKILRSGTFKVPDTIRATLYCDNIYDLTKLNDFLLPEMRKRGYVIDSSRMPVKDLIKRGYYPTEKELKSIEAGTLLEKEIPDLDIRLSDVSDQVTKLDHEFKYSIGRPQKSGYEDIQMRFVRNFDGNKSPVSHELLILAGSETSKAKHIEYEDVYKHLRLFDQLHLNKTDLPDTKSMKKVSAYMDLIRQMFRGKVSQKLFLNAKNKDLYGIMEETPISFNADDVTLFNSYFTSLNKNLSDVYSQLKSMTKTSVQKAALDKNFIEDKKAIKGIRENLAKTVEKYSS